MITMRDIARLANVSVGTVSRYLNNTLQVKAETAHRIDKAIADTNYVRNHNAASIKTKTSNTIALVFPSMQNLMFAEIADSISDVLSEKGYILTTYTTGDDLIKEKLATDKMREQRADAAIFITEPIGDKDTLHLKILEDSGICVLLINRYMDSNNFININVNIYSGVSQIVRHLVSRGYNNLGLMVGWPEQNQSKQIVSSFKEVCLESGIDFKQAYVKYMYYDETLMTQKTQELMKGGVDAIISISDLAAIQAIAEIENYGKRVPNDIAVVGMGNTRYSKIINMTSLDLHLEKLGREAAYAILSAIENGKEKAFLDIEPKLIVRQTT